MPTVLYVLACAVFAQATSEFMLAGLVSPIAGDLAVPTAVAGSLTSAFAVGMVVGAPLMAVLARRLPPRAALGGFLAAFVVAHVVGALTPWFGLLLATRVVSALANAGFLAVALAVAVRLAPPERTARATAVLLAGTTLACVVGVPAGAALGQALGWRSAFWAVAAVCLPAFVGVLRGVPAARPDDVAGAIGGELRALRRPVLVTTLVVGALVNGATFCAYTYLGPLLTDVSGLAAGWVPVGLALFGIGSFVGVTAAGRLADAHPGPVLLGGGSALGVGWVLLALVASSPVVTMVGVGILGALAFGVGSTVIARSLALTPDAPTLGGSFATAAFNVGATVGPLLGGIVLDAGSARGPVWVAAVLVAVAAGPGVAVALPRRPSAAT